MRTRILVTGDTHCGSACGLTPPGVADSDDVLGKARRVMWDWYLETLEAYGPFDYLLGTGDFTDGEGKKGTLGTLFTDTRKQAEVSATCLQVTKVPPKRMRLVRGTPFHGTGSSEYEDHICDVLPGAQIASVQRVNIAGKRIHLRHVAGSSTDPRQQATPILKEMLRVLYEALMEEKESADIVIRGHTHYAVHVEEDDRHAIQAPCLQLPLDEHNGRRYMAGRYTVGLGILDIDPDSLMDVNYKCVKMPISLVHKGDYECLR